MKYPKQTAKCLANGGFVPMKKQMAHASKPHHVFQEKGAPGTRKSLMSEAAEDTREKAMGYHNPKEDKIEMQGR